MQTSQLSGRESIWEYPRTPIIRSANRHIQVIHDNTNIADTTRALKVCENGHPPSYYLPPEDVRMELLVPCERKTFCEWKGIATYFDVVVAGHKLAEAAWSYPEPRRGFESIRDFVAFYPRLFDTCMVDGEEARPEPRPFYGGWITSDLEGPFR